MPVRLDRSSADFAERFARFLAMKREVSADIESATRAIVNDVAERGDAALIEATRRFDRLDLEAGGLRVTATAGSHDTIWSSSAGNFPAWWISPRS